MGVPSFFRWLQRKFPKIMDGCQGSPSDDPSPLTDSNMNGMEFDNLYLDMNGLIHPCVHPQDRPAPETVDDMMIMLTKYLDYLIDIVRPRRLLYLAVDGVAPRAKMNQQRSRRFKAARDARISEEENKKIAAERAALGFVNEVEKKKVFDSNSITPGTYFMQRVTETLKKYIRERIASSDYWKGIIVILSDASVPGEGEHKIIDFIRRQKETIGYEPNLKHCMYGLDADLIMLTLATHEAHFSIIREQVQFEKVPCYICHTTGHSPDQCKQRFEIDPMSPIKKPFQFLYCYVLRDYLKKELHMDGYDFERIVDDFIFFCFLVGNDFLPHTPSLEIREGAIDTLMNTYKRFLPYNGYITEHGVMNASNAQIYLRMVGEKERGILTRRRDRELERKRRYQQKKQMELEDKMDSKFDSNALSQQPNPSTVNKNEVPKIEEDEEGDEIMLGKEGYEERYYEKKFQIKYPTDKSKLKDLATSYFEGLNWVLQYYYQGCQSWDWYYPYLYSPFVYDIALFLEDDFKITYTKGIPFRPIEQLMSVLPPRSKECVPFEFHELMTSEKSPIAEFYPTTFDIDMDGKKFEYQGIVQLEFIDQNKLLRVLEPIEKKLTGIDKLRNRRYGDTLLFCSPSNPNFKLVVNEMRSIQKDEVWKQHKIKIQELSDNDQLVTAENYGEKAFELSNNVNGIAGHAIPLDYMICDENDATMIGYINPQFENGHVFQSKYLEGAVPPPCIIDFTLKNNNRGDGYYDKRKRTSYNRGGNFDYSRSGSYGHSGSFDYDPKRSYNGNQQPNRSYQPRDQQLDRSYPPQNNYPPSGGYPLQGNYPPRGGYPPQGNYPPRGGYPPQGNYPPRGGYTQNRGGYNPYRGGYQGNRNNNSNPPTDPNDFFNQKPQQEGRGGNYDYR
ncbi:5'-3' exoribonuclease [Entamoeba marina]